MTTLPLPLIGLDGSRLARSQATGTETYSDRIIRGLVGHSDSAQWRVYVNKLPEVPLPADIEVRQLIAQRLWTHARLSREMQASPPDLLFVPAHVVPLRHPRTVVTLHDLGYVHYPKAHPRQQRFALDLSTRWSARAAHHIIVPSEATAYDVRSILRVPASKITVIPHGVDERFGRATAEDAEKARSRLSLGKPYVLALGTIQPRKNLPLLARAIALLVGRGHDIDLVIAGKRGWLSGEVMREIEACGLGDRFRHLDYVPHELLPGLIAGAECLAQPSLFEGFGLPVLEAMAAGTPVVAARGSSLPEVGGDAVLYFDPQSGVELADQIGSILGSDSVRDDLARAGRSRSRGYSWEACVNSTLNVLLDSVR